ncbi:hypothetical protein MKW92_015641 [Papaver armeniacum]|nr:hypothetical protein MKW92_015641 [Papaver armeniacum]
MITGLSRSGFVAEACKVFDSISLLQQNVFSWTAMISSRTHNRQHIDALKLFFSISFLNFFFQSLSESFFHRYYQIHLLLVGSLVIAMQLHGLIVKILDEQGTKDWKDPSTWNFMMSYARNLMIHKALVTLHSMEEKDTLSWGIMISGIAECGGGIKVLDFFLRFVGSLFYDMLRRDVISWNSLILGLGQNGQYNLDESGLNKYGVSLGIYNHNTLTALLTSCSLGGLVDEGMSKNSGVKPFLDHHVCVIDMLRRAGKVAEAHNFLREMPISLNAVAWATLLNACLVHGNKDIGEVAARELQILEPGNSAGYVML